MKEVYATSPFAALTAQEQKERWICWQSQKREEKAALKHVDEKESEHESVLEYTKPTEVCERMKPRHSQYDAVIKRMQTAQRSAKTYTNCSD